MKIDKRTKFYRTFGGYKTNDYVGAVTLGLLAVLILATTLYRASHTSPQAPKSIKMIETSQSVVKVVEAYETPCDYDPLTYLRCRGEQLGINEYKITEIISTMKCESGLRPDAINKNSNGTFDLGVGQINDVHSKRISRQDRLDFVKNIDFIYKLYQEQGLRPWVCARKLGFVK